MSLVKAGALSLVFAVSIAQAGYAECEFPKRPVIPDGKTVTKEHLLEVIQVFKHRFQPDVRRFQNCIKNEQIAVGDFATDDQTEEWTSRHDAAYQIEERLAGQLNQAIRDFKAREAAGDTAPNEKTEETSGTAAQPETGEDDNTSE
ncbi:hypothetical protein [Emcibacter sp.]|uniref:hypothetical protein n=1 Tax=Emcibacter sp. TaxID=1979954 RepID=UPI002AA71E37|nr:hypothetical protein [Emcibacter sp.]